MIGFDVQVGHTTRTAKMVNAIGTYLPLARNVAYGGEVAEHLHTEWLLQASHVKQIHQLLHPVAKASWHRTPSHDRLIVCQSRYMELSRSDLLVKEKHNLDWTSKTRSILSPCDTCEKIYLNLKYLCIKPARRDQQKRALKKCQSGEFMKSNI